MIVRLLLLRHSHASHTPLSGSQSGSLAYTTQEDINPAIVNLRRIYHRPPHPAALPAHCRRGCKSTMSERAYKIGIEANCGDYRLRSR